LCRGVVLASDTLVSLDGAPLGKPADEADARRMLRALSGREHEVFSGVCVMQKSTGRMALRSARTGVTFKELSDREISDYIATGEPMDKAGAYGIQGGAGAFVTRLDGSFENVMGFPIDVVGDMLRDFGIL
ncbi:MAG: Maf-like protein, partial [Clostridiales bacterium]|nr:Maf-like protein [Clostridiales bacterium]